MGFNSGMGFGGGITMFEIMFFLVFTIVIGFIIFIVVKGIRQWNKNNNSPRLTVWALVVGKREDVSHHRSANAGDMTGAHGHHTTTSTSYYVTFQVASGDRLELLVDGYDYGMLIEGDQGNLTFQGTRYLSFERRN